MPQLVITFAGLSHWLLAGLKINSGEHSYINENAAALYAKS